MKKVKILAVLLMLVLLISCGKKGNNNKDKGFDLKNSSGTNQKVDEVQKYNYYIGVYNKLINFEKTVGSYFEKVGTEAQFKKPNVGVNANFYDVKSIITKLEKAIPAKPKMAELDKASENLLAVFKELKPLSEDMDSYYSGKDYTSDNYKKAQEFHTKLLEIIKKYDTAVLAFRTEMDKKIVEQREKEAKKLQKEGSFIAYNRMVILSVGEEVLNEINKQKLTGANVISGDAVKFKALQEKLINAVAEFNKYAKDEKQMEKEGFKDYKLRSFINEADRFKASLASLVERIETKKPISEFSLRDQFFLENETGSPENVIKSFNELVREYNSMNR